MTPEGKEIVAGFVQTFGRLIYPQPAVAKVTGTALSDLNNWRRRGYAFAAGGEFDGRVTYTAEGLLWVGLMNAAAWHFGPAGANQIVEDHINWIHDLRADTDLNFLDYAIFSTPTLPTDAGQAPCRPASLTELAQRDMRDGPIFILPLGALIASWAIGAMLATDPSD